MYIRIKKRKTKLGTTDYAYETKNIRTKKGPRQKVVSYLGRVHQLDNTKLILPFYLSTNDLRGHFADKNLKKIVEEILTFELIRHGFIKKEDLFVHKEFVVNIDDKTVRYKNKDKVVLRINKGFLCDKTIKKCFYDIQNNLETKQLIKSLLLVGLDPEEKAFTSIFIHKI